MNIITITGIRPDFIRMSEIFRKLDENFNHTLIHSGQHYDKLLSDVFFEELKIRKPDFNLEVGGPGKEHFHQAGDLSVKIIETIRRENLKPDLIIFLGDSNSVACSVPLKKEGYRIVHIEAGMRSYDRRMLEEINRVVCDHCSDHLFVYHENYKQKAMREGISETQITVVGNTIVESANKFRNGIILQPKKNHHIILDVHRPENFKDVVRLKNIIELGNHFYKRYHVPVKMLNFGRTSEVLRNHNINLENIEITPLMSYKEYLNSVYHSVCLITDSGSAQEEPALFNTPVIVPRDYTERPESVDHNCSFMVDVNSTHNGTWYHATKYVDNVMLGNVVIDPSWLGDGDTSERIINKIKEWNNE